MQMIFQDPMASLNERAKVDYIVSEGLMNFHLYENEHDRQDKVQAALKEVGLLPEFSSRFPHEFSGGQRQRIGIARSLIMQPEFIVADEPISALDVSIRAQVLNLLNDMKKKRGLTYLFIAHDLSVVRFISDRIAVIHKGRIVELAEAEELFFRPMHPYTRALLSAVPNPNPYLERTKNLLVYDPSRTEGIQPVNNRRRIRISRKAYRPAGFSRLPRAAGELLSAPAGAHQKRTRFRKEADSLSHPVYRPRYSSYPG